MVAGDAWPASRTVWLPSASLGPTPRLTDQQLATLEVLLREGAVAQGWPNHLWTAKRVAVLIQRQFGIRYHPDHVRRLLAQRLHWTSQKPQKAPANAT